MPSRGISGVTGPNVAQRPLGHDKKIGLSREKQIIAWRTRGTCQDGNNVEKSLFSLMRKQGPGVSESSVGGGFSASHQ